MATGLRRLSAADAVEWGTAWEHGVPSALHLPAQGTRLGQSHKQGFALTRPPGNYCPWKASTTAPKYHCRCTHPTYPKAVVVLFPITIPPLSEAAKAFLNYLSFLVQHDLCNALVILNKSEVFTYKKLKSKCQNSNLSQGLSSVIQNMKHKKY